MKTKKSYKKTISIKEVMKKHLELMRQLKEPKEVKESVKPKSV